MTKNGLKKKKRKILTKVHGYSFYLGTEPTEPLEWKALKNRLKPSSIKPPKLELKELPEHLEYAFLQENNQLLVVISSALSIAEKSRLLEVLKNHKGAIAYSIANIKGIDSSFCTHKILMEDEFNPMLGQRIDKHFKPIYYASKMMNEAQENYTTTEKELLAVVFAFDKFQFNIKIRDNKGAKNLAVDHLSRLENPDLGKLTKAEIRDLFLEERLMAISNKNNEPCVLTESYEGAWPEIRRHKSFDNVTADNLEDIMASPLLRERKLKSRWYRPYSVCKDMKNSAIELYDEDGNKFIINKQRVKPYQKSVLDTNRDEDMSLDNEGEVTKFLIKNEKEIFIDVGDDVRIYPDGVASPAM
ncbi:reverse transcriptase domain-containing protein [Tanacetum coccineum]